MKSVAAKSLIIVVPRQSIGIVDPGLARVECGIEASDVDCLGIGVQSGQNSPQTMRLMEGCRLMDEATA